jgi:hypothetical protein
MCPSEVRGCPPPRYDPRAEPVPVVPWATLAVDAVGGRPAMAGCPPRQISHRTRDGSLGWFAGGASVPAAERWDESAPRRFHGPRKRACSYDTAIRAMKEQQSENNPAVTPTCPGAVGRVSQGGHRAVMTWGRHGEKRQGRRGVKVTKRWKCRTGKRPSV